MRARKRGGVIIVGSGSCHTGAPNQTVYSASKAYEFNFAEGLWAELAPHNVHVLGLILGLTNTPNLARTGFKPDPAAGHVWSEPDDVAQQGLDMLGKEPIHCIGGWTERQRQLRGLPRLEAMAMIGHGVKP
jgi:short-subunit dehydrogenase